MKRSVQLIISSLLVAMPIALSSCLDEVMPTEGMTEEQVAGSPDGLINGITKHMNTIVNTDNYADCGYPSLMIYRDQMTADEPVRNPSYFYFNTFASCKYLGDWQTQTDIWNFYYQLIHCSNLAIKACDGDEAQSANLATALCYRAMAYTEMSRMYEYRPTGTSLDSYLATIGGLTVPLVIETTTEAQSFNNPRAPFYKTWRLILTDLNRAEKAITISGDCESKNKASLSLVNGLRARLWLDIATRFERFPEDMATALEKEGDALGGDLGAGYDLDPLGVANAQQAWERAATYARAAMGGHTPLSKSEWFSPTSGFNSAGVSSWIWAILMSSSDEFATTYTWQSWVSFMCPETNYGVASASYKASMSIDRALYELISPYDWRRYTWIDPDLFDQGEEAFNKYYADKTNLNYSTWSQHAPYVGFKFHPGQGVGTSSNTGNCVDIPLMRVEEMYFIEAEAAAHAYGLAQGKALLEKFLNVDGARFEGFEYTSQATTMEEFTEELLMHKRIEFWGEGITCFDIRRWGLPVTRIYEGTNHPEGYQLNAWGRGDVPAWTTIFIPRYESKINGACLQNPDPAEVTSVYQ